MAAWLGKIIEKLVSSSPFLVLDIMEEAELEDF